MQNSNFFFKRSYFVKQNPNAPYKHSAQTGHDIDYEGIEIIDRADSNFKLCIKDTYNWK